MSKKITELPLLTDVSQLDPTMLMIVGDPITGALSAAPLSLLMQMIQAADNYYDANEGIGADHLGIVMYFSIVGYDPGIAVNFDFSGDSQETFFELGNGTLAPENILGYDTSAGSEVTISAPGDFIIEESTAAIPGDFTTWIDITSTAYVIGTGARYTKKLSRYNVGDGMEIKKALRVTKI